MQFGELARYLEKLEGTSSRNEMTVILAELFKKASPEDARLVAYLSQGRLGPAYANPDMGVADKMMLRALGPQAERLFKQKGDLGLVAEALSAKRPGELTVIQVHRALGEIATAAGKDSQSKKQQLIKDLLGRLDGLAARYVVRIVLGKMRTGFSDMTILDSLSWMIVGDKSKRQEIEAMYNVRADLGEVARSMIDHGRPTKMEPRLGTPILMARAERATSTAEIWKRNGPCALEYKLDGLRIQAHVAFGAAAAGARLPGLRPGSGLRSRSASPARWVKLFSRGLEDVTAMYPDVVEGLQKQIRKDCIIEGEMIAVGKNGGFLPFQETVQRKRKYNISDMTAKVPLRIYLFDVLVVGDKVVMHQPNQKRWEELESLVAGGERVKLIDRTVAKQVTDIEKFFAHALAEGTEGVIAKKLDGPYQAGSRDFNWIKYKKSYTKSALSDTVDAVIMGYDVGQGKRSGFGIGDFLIGVYDPRPDAYLTVAKIGTGLTDEEWRRMKRLIDEIRVEAKPENFHVNKSMEVDVWARPKMVVEIQADEITKSPVHTAGFALRFPRLVSWREKKPEDATRLSEIEKLHRSQRST